MVSMRFNVERGQGFSELLALGEGRGPVAIVAFTVEAQTLAGEQTVGDRYADHFGQIRIAISKSFRDATADLGDT